MKKLYIAGPSSGGEGVYSILTDDGEVLGDHYCSSAGYARHDLEGRRPERKKEWAERFGEYEVLYLGQDDMTKSKLLQLNKEWWERNKKEEQSPPRRIKLQRDEKNK